MAISVPDWPDALGHGDFEFELVDPSIMGPKPISFGMGQTWAPDAGTWAFRLKEVPINDAGSKVHLLRAMIAGLQAPYDVVNVPVKDTIRSPRARAGMASPIALTTHSDGTPFSDLSDYSSEIVDCTLAAPATARSTAIIVTFAGAAKVMAGDWIGFGGGGSYKRAHLVGGVKDNLDGTFTLFNLLFPLRQDYAAGIQVETENPMVAMRPSKWAPLGLAMNRYARQTFEFTEAPNPA